MIHTEAKTWSDANKTCGKYGGSLASIGDIVEEQHILSKIPDKTKNYWIGLIYVTRDYLTSYLLPSGFITKHGKSYIIIRGNGSFWTDKATSRYRNWAVSEPKSSHHAQRRRCIAMWERYQLKWGDEDCTNRHFFICKNFKGM